MINKGVYICLFEHANTRKHVYEHSCSSVRVFFEYSSSFSSFSSVFFSDFRWDRLMFWYKHANTRKHVSEHSWSSGWVILSILAHLAHLAQSYFSLIFSAINTYNCSWFDLTNKKNFSDWRQKHAPWSGGWEKPEMNLACFNSLIYMKSILLVNPVRWNFNWSSAKPSAFFM